MSTPQDERDLELIDRLHTLTIEGKITWNMYYNDRQGAQQQSLQKMSQPNGFVGRDPHYGFGRITLRLYDEMEELHDDPALFVQGNRVEADEEEIYILMDAIQVQLEERRDGNGKTVEEQIQERVNQAVAPYEEEVDRLKTELSRTRQMNDRLMRMLEREMESEGDSTLEPIDLMPSMSGKSVSDMHQKVQQVQDEPTP